MIFQVQPSVVNFACAISACRHWHLALYLGLEELPSKSLAPDAVIFNALMSATRYNGRWDGFVFVFRVGWDIRCHYILVKHF
jgi:hypothetical protein